MASKGGWNGLSVQVANSIFQDYNIIIEDKKQDEGCYVATKGGDPQTIRKPRVTECAKEILKTWFILKQLT
jgi:hypothetical protein